MQRLYNATAPPTYLPRSKVFYLEQVSSEVCVGGLSRVAMCSHKHLDTLQDFLAMNTHTHSFVCILGLHATHLWWLQSPIVASLGWPS